MRTDRATPGGAQRRDRTRRYARGREVVAPKSRLPHSSHVNYMLLSITPMPYIMIRYHSAPDEVPSVIVLGQVIWHEKLWSG